MIIRAWEAFAMQASTHQRLDIAILSYHQTGPRPARGTPCRSLVLPPRMLALQLWLLHLLGWKGLSLRDLQPYLRGEKAGRVFGITFDDGYENNLAVALPLLRRLGFSATVFAVSGEVGGSNSWDRPHGVPPARLMDAAQLRAWTDAGMEIGAHTRSHPDLRQLEPHVAWDEIAGSKHDLERLLGVEVRSFSYPHGGFNPALVQAVREAGFAQAVTTRSARASAGEDPMQLPRLSVLADESSLRLVLRATTGLHGWKRRARAQVQALGSRLGEAFPQPGPGPAPLQNAADALTHDLQ